MTIGAHHFALQDLDFYGSPTVPGRDQARDVVLLNTSDMIELQNTHILLPTIRAFLIAEVIDELCSILFDDSKLAFLYDLAMSCEIAAVVRPG